MQLSTEADEWKKKKKQLQISTVTFQQLQPITGRLFDYQK